MTAEGDESRGFAGDWANIVRAVEGVQTAFAGRLEQLGLSLPYFSVLILLLDSDDHRLPMSRIARDLTMTSGGFTKLADRMARDGLIDRRGSAGDRRVVFAALTDEGLALAGKADGAYRSFLRDEVLGSVSSDDLDKLADIASRLGRVVPAEGVAEQAPPFATTSRAPDAPDRRARDRDRDRDRARR